MTARYVIGIDLGTTNCALAYVDTAAATPPKVTTFAIPQVVSPGAVEDRELLPSYLYLPGDGEQPAGA
jgi:molecular chaperone DnaK (HSP70)